MGIVGRESLEIGIPGIDSQHRELLSRFNKLLRACEMGKGKTELVGLLAFLDDYAIRHFHAEEIVLLRCNYHGYADHKNEHNKFVERLRALKVEIAIDGMATRHVAETNKLMLNWLKNHISKSDRKMGDYLKSISKSSPHIDQLFVEACP